MNPLIKIASILILTILISSCESEKERSLRLKKEEEYRIELEERRLAKEAEIKRIQEEERIEREKKEEEERIKREAQLEKERKEKEIYDKYINNSLTTGSTPYAKYYGGNKVCNENGCSEIKVRTSNSDVIVIIKKNDTPVRHAYIKANQSYKFSMPNGKYQPFFYYGKGWNPNKTLNNGKIKGGFIDREHWSKDDPQNLYNNILEYELILQQNGNFSAKSSNENEAF